MGLVASSEVAHAAPVAQTREIANAKFRANGEGARNMNLNMRQTWYESDTPPSTWRRTDGVSRVTRAQYRSRSHAISLVGVMCLLGLGCASGGSGRSSTGAEAPQVGLLPGTSPRVATETTMTLAGARCMGGQSCACRQPGHDEEETTPPAEGSKRFEIRMSATGGTAAVDLTNLGTLTLTPRAAASARDETPADKDWDSEDTTCAYIDVPIGSTPDVAFVSKESIQGQGVAPRLRIAEYGPKQHVWYDLIAVTCDGPGGRCDRHAADAWSVAARQRKRGRLDPCGSAVVTRLAWETSGGQAERAGGLFRDFTVRFTMEVKKFATQFTPGSTECVPK